MSSNINYEHEYQNARALAITATADNVKIRASVGRLQERNESLQQQLEAKDKMCEELVETLARMTGHNLPNCYDYEEDECGSCPYCRNVSYEPHDDTCAVAIAEKLLSHYHKQRGE